MMTTVEELMVEAVVVAKAGETVGEVREKMTSLDIGAVPVVDDAGSLVGILTVDDLVSGYPMTLPVSRVMSTEVVTMTPTTDVRHAAIEMRRLRRHHVVVRRGDKIVGILSSWDLLSLIGKVTDADS